VGVEPTHTERQRALKRSFCILIIWWKEQTMDPTPYPLMGCQPQGGLITAVTWQSRVTSELTRLAVKIGYDVTTTLMAVKFVVLSLLRSGCHMLWRHNHRDFCCTYCCLMAQTRGCWPFIALTSQSLWLLLHLLLYDDTNTWMLICYCSDITITVTAVALIAIWWHKHVVADLLVL